MVQRKVSNKLGIQADHVNSLDNQVGNLKQVNSQNQDGRNNRGAPDLKKKMKKSRSIKLSESLRPSSSPLKQNISLPGKPPPQTPDVLANASSAIQPKQSMMKTSDRSKNYMKSTTSSDARKERAQVSPQTGSDSENPSRKNLRRSKPDSSSGNKPARSLTRSSSLKLVRTLTKTPSFKHVRSLSAAKKCSKVALCTQKATCSSTLKDTKFPSYLMLNPGGSELDGTSVMKVCPYTYCSLNGHYHTPLPPLKCFLSTKRRLLKTQKNMKLEALSPRRVETSNNGTKETNTEKVVSDGKPSFQEEGLGSSAISTLIRDGSMDFFIEIYARDKDDTTETTGSGKDDDDDQKTTDFTRKMEGFEDLMSSVGGVNERTEEHGDKQDAESISDGSTNFEIHFENNLDQNIQISSEGMDITESFDGELEEEEEEEEEYADEGYPSFFPQEETTLQYIDNGSDGEGECSASVVELDKSDSEASDMEWEEGPFTASHFDNERNDTTQTGDEVDSNVIHPSEVDNPNLLIKSNFEPDDAVSNCFEQIVADELLQEVCEEESASFELKFVEDESGPDEVNQDLDDEEFSQASDTQNHDQLTFPNDASEESIAAEEKYIVAETDEHVATSASIKEINEGLTAACEGKNAVCSVENEILIIDPQPVQGNTNCTTVVADEAFLTDHQENEFEQDDDAYALLKNQTTDFTHGFNETDQDESNEGQIQEQKSIEYKNDVTEKSRAHDMEINESLHPETENSQTTTQNVAISDFGLEQQLSGADIGDSMDKSDQDSNSLLEIHITVTEPSQVCSEAKQEASVEDYTESHKVIKDCQDDANAEECDLGQHFVDGSLLSVTQDHASDIQLQNQNGAENQNHSVKDHCEAEFKSPNSMDSEEQKDSDLTLCSLAEPSIGEVDDMEMEGSVASDAMETCLRTDTVTNAETGNKSFNVRINTNQEHPETRKTLKGSIKCKPVKDFKEQKDFNPREPNYLSVESDPEAEKVDLRPQMIDERKNAEEWMLDYALQQAVTKLAPARKRRVALLVEAFETVKPIPKYETHRKHASPAFGHVRPLQTCI